MKISAIYATAGDSTKDEVIQVKDGTISAQKEAIDELIAQAVDRTELLERAVDVGGLCTARYGLLSERLDAAERDLAICGIWDGRYN